MTYIIPGASPVAGGRRYVGSGVGRILTMAIFLAGGLLAAQPPSSSQVEWAHYGGDPGGTKYSTLTGITPQNVQNLHVAW